MPDININPNTLKEFREGLTEAQKDKIALLTSAFLPGHTSMTMM